MDVMLVAVPFFVAAIFIEAYWFRDRGYYRLNDTISNFMAGMFQQILAIVPMLLMIGSYTWIYQSSGFFSEYLTQDKWWLWLLLFIAEDLKYYWFHRASHRIALFWSGHCVHHQSEEYNFSVALRQSTLQDFFVIPWAWPFAVLGIDPFMYIAVHLTVIVIQFWIHTRTIGKLPAYLESWLNTPSHHRVHHARNPEYIDSNYGGVFIIWDRIFSSFVPEQEEAIYGVTTPTKSWNPVQAQFATLMNLYHAWRKERSWRAKWMTIFAPPGWSKTQPNAKPEMILREKYDPPLSPHQSRQIIMLLSLILVLAMAFLLEVTKIPMLYSCVFALGLIGALVGLGRRLEGNIKEKR